MLLGDISSPPITLHTLLTGWQTNWLTLLALVVELAALVAYVAGVKRLARKGRRWSRWRTTSFTAGVVSLVISVQSGLAAYQSSVFTATMLQHVILMNVAPILFALSAPVTLLLQASSRPTQTKVLKVLGSRPAEILTQPIFVALLAYTTMTFYFFTPIYQIALEHPLLLDVIQLHFFLSGCLFWWLIVGLDPIKRRLSYPARLAMLAAGIPVGSILGMVLTGARTSIAPAFQSVSNEHTGGGILWVLTELTTLFAMSIIVVQWMHYEEREAIRADRRADAEAQGSGTFHRNTAYPETVYPETVYPETAR